jgi:hypothetical protein
MAFSKHDPAEPVRVRVFSPLGLYPQHSITIPGARLLVREDFIVSVVRVESPEAHGFGDEHFSDFEFLALEETRFLAAITLTVHPDEGMAYTYPLREHVNVAFGLDDDALLEVAQRHVARASESGWWRNRGAVGPPASGGSAYERREAGVDVARVLNVVRAIQLGDTYLCAGSGRCCGPICAGSTARSPRRR